MALSGSGGSAFAQTVEQHPAPILQGPQTTTISAAALETRLTDATSLGVNLTGLSLVDAHANGSKLLPKTGPGIDISRAGSTAKAPEFRALLQKYIGQPLSYQAIGAIEAEITKYYRDNGRALVLVTVPPQEVTSGVLQVNVNTFVLERTAVQGAAPGAEGYVAAQVRVKPGQEVDTATLLADVNWLNLNPFRHVSVVFEPGKAADSTTLTLKVQNGRPWSAYAGASNAGTRDTGLGRVFAGFNLSALPWQDHQLSYQFNGAPQSLGHVDLWDTGKDKGYVSHALSYFVPVTLAEGFRFKVKLGLSHISSYSVPGGAFTASTTTNGATADFAVPLPATTGQWKMTPEVFIGWAGNAYDRGQFLGPLRFSTEDSHLQHLELGLRSSLNGKLFGRPTHGDFAVSVVAGHLRQDINGTRTTASYGYAKASIAQEIMLDGGPSLALRFGGQYSNDTLHPLEQLALGGDGTVRGYPTNAVSGETAASFSIEYRAAPVSVPLGKMQGELRPHVFADLGVTDPSGLGKAEHLASIGLGGDFTMGENFVAKIDVTQTLTAAGSTAAHEASVAFQLTARF